MDLGRLPELIGRIGGVPLAAPVAVGTRARRSRLFHPRGLVLGGQAVALGSGARRALGERLAGPVLVRFSGAWWKDREWPDVLGCALRFRRRSDPSATPEGDDQDLLLATIRSPWTTLLAALGTHVHDYLDNDYFGVSPFADPDLGRIKLRLRPGAARADADSRPARLLSALERGPIELVLEARPARLGSRYAPVAKIDLRAELPVDQNELRFDPFRDGRGLAPAGLVQHLRIATYAAGQRCRAVTSSASACEAPRAPRGWPSRADRNHPGRAPC